MKKVNSLLLLSLLLSMAVVSTSITSMPVYLAELPNTSPRLSSLVPHDRISIVGNAAFASQGWPGDGTQQSPYIIEGFEIVTDSTCIYIFNTNAHFIIRNCILSSQANVAETGIWLSHISNGAIENCSISNKNVGIVLVSPQDCIITNSTLTGCDSYGILLGSGNNCTFSENRIINCDGYGFYSQYSQNVTVANNEITDSDLFGLYITSTANCTFVNNTFQNGGIGIRGDKQYWIHDFSENVVNGKPFGYFCKTNDTEIDGSLFGQLFLIDCINVGLSSGVFFNASVGLSLLSCMNCTISDMNLIGNLHGIDLLKSENITLRNNSLIGCGVRFDGNDTKYWTVSETGNTVNGKQFGYFLNQENLLINGDDYGQLVLVDSDHLSMANGTFDSVTVGLVCYYCFNCSVRNALFVNDYFEGIGILNSPNCTLVNVTIEGCRDGGLCIIESDNATVTESEIHGNRYGIWLTSSDYYLFDSNQIYDNHENPIYLRDNSYGVVRNNLIHDNRDSLELYVVNWLEITNNSIFGSSSDGLYLDFTSGVVIRDNRVYGNADYGLRLGSYTVFSEIYNNMIGFNEAGNAVDNGFFNYWDDGVATGNVWSDYSGAGVYSVSGMGVDNYPRGFLTRPVDVWYFVGASVPSVTWDVRLPNPDSYTILWNGVVITQGSLNSSLEHPSKSIEGLPIGDYSVTLVVNDGSGYSLVDTVIITVVEEPTTTTTTTTTTGTSSTTTNTTTPPDMTIIYIVIAAGVGGAAVGAVVTLVVIAIRKRNPPL